MGKGGEGRRREGRAGEGKFAPAPSKYIWIDAADLRRYAVAVAAVAGRGKLKNVR